MSAEKLTSAERRALDDYSGVEFANINSALRGVYTPTGDHAADVNAKVAAINAAIAKGTLANNSTLYRGSNLALFGGKLPAVGTTMSDKAFLSTSRSAAVANNFGDVTIRISAPKGTRAADVSHHTGGREQETLLSRNTKLKVTSVGSEGGRPYINATVVR